MSPQNQSWDDVLKEHDGNTLTAARHYFLTTGGIHPEIPEDDLREIRDAVPIGGEFGEALNRALEIPSTSSVN